MRIGKFRWGLDLPHRSFGRRTTPEVRKSGNGAGASRNLSPDELVSAGSMLFPNFRPLTSSQETNPMHLFVAFVLAVQLPRAVPPVADDSPRPLTLRTLFAPQDPWLHVRPEHEFEEAAPQVPKLCIDLTRMSQPEHFRPLVRETFGRDVEFNDPVPPRSDGFVPLVLEDMTVERAPKDYRTYRFRSIVEFNR